MAPRSSATNDFLDELWCNADDKMVPYTPAFWQLWKADKTHFLFAAIEKALVLVDGRLLFLPLRNYTRRKCLEWIE
jgi:squalene-hopene/tetraprenyl-beta-curcumene cyclase